MGTTTKHKNIKNTYWYKFYSCECPVCGRGTSYKERIYDKPKPDNLEEIYEFDECYDNCLSY
jgi:hypothetical protein